MVVAESEMGSDVYAAPRLSFPQGLLVTVVLWVNTTLGLGPNVYKQRGPLGTLTTLAALLTTLQINPQTERKPYTTESHSHTNSKVIQFFS